MIKMVVYSGKLIKMEPVYGEVEGQVIEIWATFEIGNNEIEVFLDNFYVVPRKYLLDGVGKIFNLNLALMSYDIFRINIEDKMLKQITKFPGEDKYGRPWPSIPMYFLMGEITKLKSTTWDWGDRVDDALHIFVDCGILIDTVITGHLVNELRVGDYVAIIGKMFGKIVEK